MLNTVVKYIKKNIAQHTHLFDLNTQNKVANVHSNVIEVDGLDGEYTLSGADSGIASAGCINDTHLFDNGSVVTSCFFGNDETNHNVEARTLDVGHAFKRSVALEAIVNPDSKNRIIVYVGSANTLSDQYLYSESEDMNFKVGYTIGVMFKANAVEMKEEELGCTNYDKLFINSVINARKEGTSLVKFNNVVDRFFAGDSYVVDIEFSYTDEMFMDESFLNGLKHFDGTLGDLDIQ